MDQKHLNEHVVLALKMVSPRDDAHACCALHAAGAEKIFSIELDSCFQLSDYKCVSSAKYFLVPHQQRWPCVF